MWLKPRQRNAAAGLFLYSFYPAFTILSFDQNLFLSYENIVVDIKKILGHDSDKAVFLYLITAHLSDNSLNSPTD